MLSLSESQRAAMIATCIRALPDEGCGLFLGTRDGDSALVSDVISSENVAHSAKVYEIDSRILLKAYRRADDEGIEVLGVFHSHTHSEAYPSPTDVRQAPDPSWHYVLISLRDIPSVIRSYRIVDGQVSEEAVVGH